MTEAYGRHGSLMRLRKELAIVVRRVGFSSRSQHEEKPAAPAARLHRRDAGDLLRGKARGAPRSPDRIGLQGCAPRWDRSLHRGRESAWRRSRSHSRPARSLRSERVGRVAARRNSPAGDTPEIGARTQGFSRVRRETPSGRTGRIALSSDHPYRIVVCMSRLTASRSSLSGRGARCARRRRVSTRSSSSRRSERDAMARSSIPRLNPRNRAGRHGLSSRSLGR